VVTDDKGLTSDPDTVEVKVVPNNRIYSSLKKKPYPWLFWHKYKFSGVAGEKVTITLEANPKGWNKGKKATIILKDSKIPGVKFMKKDSSSLPNTITAELPADGEYSVYVVKQPWFCPGKSFKGAYILTLEGTCGKLMMKMKSSPWKKKLN
jgi:hypothetical protein